MVSSIPTVSPVSAASAIPPVSMVSTVSAASSIPPLSMVPTVSAIAPVVADTVSVIVNEVIAIISIVADTVAVIVDEVITIAPVVADTVAVCVDESVGADICPRCFGRGVCPNGRTRQLGQAQRQRQYDTGSDSNHVHSQFLHVLS